MLAHSAILTLKITFKSHKFRFSIEVTLTSAFDTITSHKFLRDPVSSCHPVTRQVTSPKQVTLGISILGLSFLQASYPPRRRDSSSTSSIEDSRVTRRSWETTCQPTLEDHDSRQPERKRHFLLAYSRHEGSSFAFCC